MVLSHSLNIQPLLQIYTTTETTNYKILVPTVIQKMFKSFLTAPTQSEAVLLLLWPPSPSIAFLVFVRS